MTRVEKVWKIPSPGTARTVTLSCGHFIAASHANGLKSREETLCPRCHELVGRRDDYDGFNRIYFMETVVIG